MTYKKIHANNVDESILVSEQDYAWRMQHTWSVATYGSSGRKYAMTQVPQPNGKQKTVYMHRMITKAQEGQIVKHLSHQSLDNRRENLKIVESISDCERSLPKTVWGKSRYFGVHPLSSGKFRSSVRVNGKALYLGTYKTEEEAALVINNAIEEYNLDKEKNTVIGAYLKEAFIS